ncbi:MAG: hypothetical protein Q8K79_04460 [Solirubrobacteraceae bacterium]|nr:hypothetical protein [Solirubrobacteraceae bacterium]
MQRIATIVAALAAAVLWSAAGTAQAATLTTDTRCYQETQEVIVNGAGFAPSSVVTISRDGTVLGSTTTDANGAFRNKFDTPELPKDVRERLYRLSATDSTTTAQTNYRSTRIFASFRPRKGNPSTLRVRFSIFGFGLVQRRAPVYLHYVRPGGRVARTIRLGTATGVCGAITQTRARRLFAFEASKGVWILQFDTRKRYERATSKRRTPWVRKPVEIFSRNR